MRNITKLGGLDHVLTLSEDAVARIGTVGVAAGSLLALVVLMF